MCGITGFIGAPDGDVLAALSDSLIHRGPDDAGTVERSWASMASRRLAILDIDNGHQPMSSGDGRLHVAYNGEVYNYRELREELIARGCRFATDSDTEVVLRAFEADGPACFARFNGMFAVAFLDERGPWPELVLARDQLGIKPLYHTTIDGRFVFASEIKSFLADPAFVARPDEQRIYEYLGWGFHDHDGRTFLEDVRSLRAGSYLVVRDGEPTEHRYWIPRLTSDGDPDPHLFRELVERAVARRLVADQRVGTCLSGGLDSSTIVAVIADLVRQGHPDAASVGERLATFSAVYPGDPIDERRWIGSVLRSTDAESHFVTPSSPTFISELSDFVWALDEPTVSSGPYAQWSVMRLAQGHVKVLLDGQGGDELLGGYVSYRFVYLRQLWRERRLRRLVREGLRPSIARVLLQHYAMFPFGRPRTEAAHYLRRDFAAGLRRPVDRRPTDDLKARLLADLTTYSLPSLLRYEDRTSMAHSIESRPPLLDLDLVEHVLTLPVDALIHHGRTRAILRDAMEGLLPEAVRSRTKKIGFTTPETRWLIREQVAIRRVFTSPSFRSRRYWHARAIAGSYDEVCSGRRASSLFYWRVLNLEMWLRLVIDGERRPAVADPARATPTAA